MLVAKNATENKRIGEARVRWEASASMHHRIIPATIAPTWTKAFTMPPAAFQMSGSSRKPAAETGSATE